MMRNAVIFNKKIIISCITVIAAVLLCAFCACIGGRGPRQESTAAPALLTPSAEPTAEMTIKPSAAATNDPEEDIVAEMMTEMTLEEKVGQLFIVRPESLDESFTPNQAHGSARYSDTDCSAGMADFLAAHPAGGIAFFGKISKTRSKQLHSSKIYRRQAEFLFLLQWMKREARLQELQTRPPSQCRNMTVLRLLEAPAIRSR